MVYDFGDRLRELREKRNLSQAQVAKTVGVTRSTISSYENNIAMPSADVIIKLTLLYHTTSDYILGIDNRHVIIVDGISEKQQSILESIIDMLLIEFKNKK